MINKRIGVNDNKGIQHMDRSQKTDVSSKPREATAGRLASTVNADFLHLLLFFF